MRKILLATTLALVTASTYAATGTSPSTSGQQGRPYIGFQLGDGQTKLGSYHINPALNPSDSLTSSNSENGLAIMLYGGYKIPLTKKLSWGVELGLGKFANSDINLRTDSASVKLEYENYHIDALATLNYKITPKFILLGKAGASSIHQKLSEPSNSISNTQSKILPKIELGAGYQIIPQGMLAFSFNTTLGGKARAVDIQNLTDIVTQSNHVVNYQAIMLGFNYSF